MDDGERTQKGKIRIDSVGLQIIIVIIFFGLMVVFTGFYVSNMVRTQLQREAQATLTEAQLRIEQEFNEADSMIRVISSTIRRLSNDNQDVATIRSYIEDTAVTLKSEDVGFQFDELFGVFDTYDDIFLHDTGWEPPPDYVPSERVWYQKAVEAGGNVVFTSVYESARTGNTLVGFSQQVNDFQGNRIAVICLAIKLDDIRYFVEQVGLTESGFAVLITEDFEYIAFPNPDLIGQNMKDVVPQLYQEASRVEVVHEYEMVNYYGVSSIVYSRTLNIGWRLFLITPKEEYYQTLTGLTRVIVLMGISFAVILSAILVRLGMIRKKIDHENREKTIRIVELNQAKVADERTRIMLDLVPFGVCFWNQNADMIDCNTTMLRLFDAKNQETFARDFLQYSPEYQPDGSSSVEAYRMYFKKAFEVGYLVVEWTHQMKDQYLIPCEITLLRVNYKGEQALLSCTQDLREIKKVLLEMKRVQDDLRIARNVAEESNRVKSKFLAMVSHEIRTPMNVILGITESNLQLDVTAMDVKESFEKIYNSGELLLNIINDILDLSKIESGKFELIPAKYQFASLVNDVSHMNMMRLDHKSLNFTLHIDENIPVELMGDELRIKQILNNILSNAYKYTETGEVVLSFHVHEYQLDPQNQVILSFSVKDTGRGMTEDQVSRLFQEYTRFNVESDRTTTGTGLGMAITSNLVNLMNGTISVESELGVGSIFIVTIPQGLVSDKTIGFELAQNLEQLRLIDRRYTGKEKIKREPMPYGKILLVDDMDTNLDVAELLLRPYQLQVEKVKSGFEAIDRVLEGKQYDIIFMDHMMPQMDGIETTMHIREQGYQRPIVALTANAIVGQSDVFLSNGFDGYITKPIDTRQLNETLNRFVKRTS